ncbi:MAG: insulinase family protein [Actinobacteria bacterium]|nr:insulinase family protein [Actinomycetota bacterium]MBI3688587.1 insulinase family protein [Actinomycetota bacterium]
MTVPDRRPVPPLGPPPKVIRPDSAERALATGLRVVAVRQPGVPLVELRLRIPFSGTTVTHPARVGMLAKTLLAGTARRDRVAFAEAVQALGGSLHASVDADRLLLGGVVLNTALPDLLELLGEALTEAAYPAREVGVERDRLVEQLAVARSQPSVLAREALRRTLYADHPYARELPTPRAVAAVTAPRLRELHTQRVVPAGADLVLVGDLAPERALDQVETALAGWKADGAPQAIPVLPPIVPAAVRVVHRPGAVQSSIRIGGTGLRRHDPAYPATQLANLVFGGYFSSRLVSNIREDKGYTYGAHSRIDHGAAGSTLLVDADVATDVTAAAMVEIGYELGRIATTRPTEQELDDVRQYAIGTLAMSVATQAGLASTLSVLAGVGLGLSWLREHPERLARVTLDEAFEAAGRVLAPAGLATVVLGDAERIAPGLALLAPVEVVTNAESPRP